MMDAPRWLELLTCWTFSLVWPGFGRQRP